MKRESERERNMDRENRKRKNTYQYQTYHLHTSKSTIFLTWSAQQTISILHYILLNHFTATHSFAIMLPRIISIWLDILFVVPGKRKGSSVMCIVVMRTESVCALLVFMARHNTKITAKKKNASRRLPIRRRCNANLPHVIAGQFRIIYKLT